MHSHLPDENATPRFDAEMCLAGMWHLGEVLGSGERGINHFSLTPHASGVGFHCRLSYKECYPFALSPPTQTFSPCLKVL